MSQHPLRTLIETCDAAISHAFTDGGKGASELARAVVAACEQPSQVKLLYPTEMSLAAKLATLVECGYGGRGVRLSDKARQQLVRLSAEGWDHLPICVAKTQYSFSTDPGLRGAPDGHVVDVREVRLSAGAGFVVMICGDIMTMPGLPKSPSALRIDVDDQGRISGLF